MTLELSGKLECLFSAQVEKKDDSYIVEIPEHEVESGDIEEGETYKVGLLKEIEGTQPSRTTDRGGSSSPQPPVEEGEIRYVEVEDIGKQGDGIARVERGYVIIVPDMEIGDRVKIEIKEVQDNFAVAEVLEEDAFD